MANKNRGEVEIPIGPRTITVRPTFDAIVEIEDRTGSAMMDLVRRSANGSIRSRDIAIIVWCGARAFNKASAPPLADIGAALIEHGVEAVLAPLADFLIFSVGGLREAKPGENPPAPAADSTSAG